MQVKVGESVYRRNRPQLIHADETRHPDTQELVEPESIIPQPEAGEPETTASIIPVPKIHPDQPRRSQRKHKLHIWWNDHVPR